MKKIAIALTLGLLSIPAVSASETFKETYECKFGRGLVNKPTPEFLVFSVDDYGRSAYIHEIEMPDIHTQPGPARVKRDSIRNLSVSWVGRDYVYSATGRSYASNESRIDAIDLLNHEFTVILDRRTLKATTRSTSHSAYLPRDGFARGKCKQIPTPSS